MQAKKVVICGVDTSKLTTLKPEEASVLMKRIKTGCEVSRQQFLYGNLKLVLSISRRFIDKKVSLDDIFQIGIIGLIKAVDNFDEKFNVKFSTYAVPMIIGEIKRFLRDNTCMRVSRSIRDTAYQVLLAREKLSGKNQEEIKLEDIAKELNLDLQKVACAVESTLEPISLFSNVYNDSGSLTILDSIIDERTCGDKMLDRFILNVALNDLDEREKEIINLRYYQGKTQIEVSEEVGISQAQVSRLEKNALKTLSKQF